MLSDERLREILTSGEGSGCDCADCMHIARTIAAEAAGGVHIGEPDGAYIAGFRAGLEAAAGVVRRNCAGYLPDGARCGDDVLLNPDSMDGYTETARCEACDAAADIRAIPDPEAK